MKNAGTKEYKTKVVDYAVRRKKCHPIAVIHYLKQGRIFFTHFNLHWTLTYILAKQGRQYALHSRRQIDETSSRWRHEADLVELSIALRYTALFDKILIFYRYLL